MEGLEICRLTRAIENLLRKVFDEGNEVTNSVFRVAQRYMTLITLVPITGVNNCVADLLENFCRV